MPFEIQYGTLPIVFPTIPDDVLAVADVYALRLLAALAADRSLLLAGRDDIANRLGFTPGQTDSAIAFWREKNILVGEPGGEKASLRAEKAVPDEKKRDAAPPKRTKVSELSVYTDSEFAEVMEKNRDLADLITEAQNTLGKIFNVNETKILVSITQEFGFDEEFMLILLDFCRRTDHKNMRYIERLATSLYDEEIRNPEALTECLRRRERIADAESKIRSVFGIGSRALTSKEKNIIGKWIDTYKLDFPLIEKAYEITINATSKPSLNYANRILESWYSEGITTAEQADAAKAKKDETKPKGALSFDVDDFFEAALNRSYDDTGNGDKK